MIEGAQLWYLTRRQEVVARALEEAERAAAEQHRGSPGFKNPPPVEGLNPQEMRMSQTPSVGQIVHYVSYGTPGGEYPSVCRAAIITAVDTYQDGVGGGGLHIGHVSLCVLNPEGQFFNRAVQQSEDDHRGGTWHWPERV